MLPDEQIQPRGLRCRPGLCSTPYQLRWLCRSVATSRHHPSLCLSVLVCDVECTVRCHSQITGLSKRGFVGTVLSPEPAHLLPSYALRSAVGHALPCDVKALPLFVVMVKYIKHKVCRLDSFSVHGQWCETQSHGSSHPPPSVSRISSSYPHCVRLPIPARPRSRLSLHLKTLGPSCERPHHCPPL